jgi:hypothetical protein
MPETVLKAPNYFDREFDLTERTIPVGGTPATVIGGAEKGPAFVPISLGSYTDFANKFGDVTSKYVGPYALQKFFEAKGTDLASCNYIRVLGCGANSSSVDISTTETEGTVVNAGMKVVGDGTAFVSGALQGRVQFLVGKHFVQSNEAFGLPDFTNNDSFNVSGFTPDNDTVNLVRAVLFTTPDARFIVMSGAMDSTYDPTTLAAGTNNYESAQVGTTGLMQNLFKLALSSSDGSSFASDDGFAGLKIFSASLDPSSDKYVGKMLNTNPENFAEQKHLLYLEYPVDTTVAVLSTSYTADNSAPTVAVVSGSSNQNSFGHTFGEAFGYFNTRYKTPKTPYFISQPIGGSEYDLFYVESRDDGEYANTKYKISIANLQLPTNGLTNYGTFTLYVRAFSDVDEEPQILESFNNLSLDPSSENYIAKVIGNKRTKFNFDAIDTDDRSLVISGKYGNRSKYIRVVTSEQLDAGQVPQKAIPFGFRGHQMLATNTSLTDVAPVGSLARITGVSSSVNGGAATMTGSIVPPVPFRFTITRNPLTASGILFGAPDAQTTVDGRLFWGVKFERNNNSVLNTNVNTEANAIIANFAKFSGIEEQSVLTTGSDSDVLNNNKFTLARVALSASTMTEVAAATPSSLMRDAAYLRNAQIDPITYKPTNIDTANNNRITFAGLVNSGSAVQWNTFSNYAKFTTFMQGGWDGVNIFDKQAARFTDRSTSTEAGVSGIYGLANASYVSPGAPSGVNYTGVGAENSNVAAFRTAIAIATNATIANNNILAVPGQRDPLITDYALEKNLDYGLSFYVMDIQTYDQDGTRIFDGETGRYASITQTSTAFINRNVDNNAAAAYFPNIVIDDVVNTRRVTVPSSVAAVSALAYNDRVKFPWFAPAGFDRGSLAFVLLTSVRVNQTDRNTLFDANINPIVKFPGANYVFFSQNTLQQATSALESINVKRMVLEVKRQIVAIGNRLLFEQNTPALRSRFVNEATLVLAGVQLQQGIEQFAVVCDQRNNTAEDVNSNRMNAQIRVLPTRAIEYIVMDFVVLPSGVSI